MNRQTKVMYLALCSLLLFSVNLHAKSIYQELPASYWDASHRDKLIDSRTRLDQSSGNLTEDEIDERWGLLNDVAGNTYFHEKAVTRFTWQTVGEILVQEITQPGLPAERLLYTYFPQTNIFMLQVENGKEETKTFIGKLINDGSIYFYRHNAFQTSLIESFLLFPYKDGYGIAQGEPNIGFGFHSAKPISIRSIDTALLWRSETSLSSIETDQVHPSFERTATPGSADEVQAGPTLAGLKIPKSFNVIKPGESVTGKLARSKSSQRNAPSANYLLEAKAGQTLDAVLESTSFFPFLSFHKADGARIESGTGKQSAGVRILIPEDGVYMIVVTAMDSQRQGEFTLTINDARSAHATSGSHK